MLHTVLSARTVNVILTRRNLKTIQTASTKYRSAPVLIAVCHRDQVEFLNRALESIERQSLFVQGGVQVVVLDDSSEHEQFNQLKCVADKPYVTILTAHCGNATQARNTILDWADAQPAIKWVARLDADDELFEQDSLRNLINVAERHGKKAAIGGNALRLQGRLLEHINHPQPIWSTSPTSLIQFIDRFSSGQSEHELPSCNLVLSNRSGIRYPNVKSAEDHWLVASLLLLEPKHVAIDPVGVYSIYSLSGQTTHQNKVSSVWQSSRAKLASVARSIFEVQQHADQLLGFGMEGVVYRQGQQTIKLFHPWGLSDHDANRLQQWCNGSIEILPTGNFVKKSDRWYFYSDSVAYQPISGLLSQAMMKRFLIVCYQKEVAPLNIKRTNLMIHPNGDLHYIDIGKDIVKLTASCFLDLSARLYAIGSLNYSDYELIRRQSASSQELELQQLEGFTEFYAELICDLHPTMQILDFQKPQAVVESSTTLLIKACAQDADNLSEQVIHIVSQLEYPRRFAAKILLIDPYAGPFLRQYAQPNLQSVLTQADGLLQMKIIDAVLIVPTDCHSIIKTYQKWFGNTDVMHTHTKTNAPLFPQLWGFDQLKTRYVLQCDCDVLIGRKDWQHDYLGDMLRELEKPAVQSVGFNIPKSGLQFLDYFGEPGQFAPEVRLGLLDLHKFNARLPLLNPVEQGQFCLTWHRAMQQDERKSGQYRAVRGGDPRTFYVHPNNVDKPALADGRIKDLIAQGIVPDAQQEAFDLVVDSQWQYPPRTEEVIFLLKGRNTPHTKLQRCIDSLKAQNDQQFGVILIDDASEVTHATGYAQMLACFDSLTLIRNSQHQGRIPNFITAINIICQEPASLLVILDQDDALMHPYVVSNLKQALRQGHDLIQMPMYRPNKPIKTYRPSYQDCRSKHGANVWAHLRAFTKQCFNTIPQRYFQRDNGQWFDSVTDYATMLPLSEVAQNPVFLDGPYAYWHERSDYSPAYKDCQQQLLSEIFAKPALATHKAVAALEQAGNE
ncbi:glycosyltransferase family 2 protein [Nitrincola nitratireducens]|uniref:glycosyltransferase family 2 protein n=1 Tax=Nitrincola nitratireducens TaxID=1229521 RepID=UPI00138AB631|nr:glycosyltransferase family A protein [Nitrincola nitratireducens]